MRLLSLTMLCLSTVLCVGMLAQDTPPPQKKGGGMPHTNLKILKDENIGQIMQGYRAALGVQCTYCHIQGNFASDENPKKEIARHMITMAQEINGKFPDGKEHVTCYTCHRGAAMPLTAPPPAGQ
ncbi:MAG: c-type cytochrome [Candidatus Sulfopaludibacter sp.]|nr:c-type cytochrome [Candidatus Sulfopaludibacter sp.]